MWDQEFCYLAFSFHVSPSYHSPQMIQGSYTSSCLCVASIWVAEEKEEGSDEAVTLQRGYAWFHLLHPLFVSASLNLFVCLPRPPSNLESAAPHLLILIALYLVLPASTPNLSFHCLFSAKVVMAICSFLP